MANNDVLTEESVLQLINQLVGIEAAARESADTQEIIDRQAADESLNQLVEQEIDARKAALSALQSTVISQSPELMATLLSYKIYLIKDFKRL